MSTVKIKFMVVGCHVPEADLESINVEGAQCNSCKNVVFLMQVRVAINWRPKRTDQYRTPFTFKYQKLQKPLKSQFPS